MGPPPGEHGDGQQDDEGPFPIVERTKRVFEARRGACSLRLHMASLGRVGL